jgi:nucleoside-diphosphate-sugar epimerase
MQKRKMSKDKILVTGAGGQLGAVLTEALNESYSTEQIIVSDIKSFDTAFPYCELDVTDKAALADLVQKESINQIYHLAAILSAKGEKDPLKTRHINTSGMMNVLEVSRQTEVRKIFYPSSIAVFGEGANLEEAKQYEPLVPSTVYGITKVDGELWANYYWERYQLDIRSLRYPGVIGYQSMPGGGTTDYAVDIFHAALKGDSFNCFLKKDTTLPMIYMDDAIRATMELMEAPAEKLNIRTSYNLHGLSFSPEEIYQEIKKHIPSFEINYKPDYRQKIAEGWPRKIDDTEARQDWAWSPNYDLQRLVGDMIKNLKQKISKKI